MLDNIERDCNHNLVEREYKEYVGQLIDRIDVLQKVNIKKNEQIRNLSRKNNNSMQVSRSLSERIVQIRDKGISTYKHTQDFPEEVMEDIEREGGWFN